MSRQSDLTAVIICGGRGLRAWPLTDQIPKPLIKLAGIPLVEHVMDLLARQGVTHFILAAGYRHQMVREYAESLVRPWRVDVVSSPPEGGTWTRVTACQEYLSDPFLLTYTDGLANVNIELTRCRHEAADALATITVAPAASPYGLVTADRNSVVTSFQEKPILESHLMNIGFMLLRKRVFKAVAHGDWGSLEMEVLPALAEERNVLASRHNGFYRGVDTYKDVVEVEELIESGQRPWYHSSTRLTV